MPFYWPEITKSNGRLLTPTRLPRKIGYYFMLFCSIVQLGTICLSYDFERNLLGSNWRRTKIRLNRIHTVSIPLIISEYYICRIKLFELYIFEIFVRHIKRLEGNLMWSKMAKVLFIMSFCAMLHLIHA